MDVDLDEEAYDPRLEEGEDDLVEADDLVDTDEPRDEEPELRETVDELREEDPEPEERLA